MTTAEVPPTSVWSNVLSPAMADIRSCGTAVASARYKIMVVDDTPINLKVIRAHLAREGYERIKTLDDSREAVAALLREDPDLLLLDLMMPHVSGLKILETVREMARFSCLPVIVITAAEDREMKTKSLELGANDFLSKPVDAEDLILRVRNALKLKSYQDSLEEKVFQRTAELTRSREEIVYCLARAAEYRDNETGNHVIRVGRYVGLVAAQLGVDEHTRRMMELASTLHDMGKLGIPDAILLTPGTLTPEERIVINKHCKFGAEICTPDFQNMQQASPDHVVAGAMMFGGSASSLLQMASRIALTHHERWDGEGYPRGLEGEEIPLEGRIAAVADVFDALGSKRPYKPAFPLDKCFAIIEEETGKHFDPAVVQAFLARKDSVIAVYNEFRDL